MQQVSSEVAVSLWRVKARLRVWAVIALGGIPNKTQVGDRGVDGRIFPVGTKPSADGLFSEDWFTIQVKQMDKAGRPDIDAFQAVMEREGEGGDSAVSSSVSGILKTPSRNALHFTSEGVESSSS